MDALPHGMPSAFPQPYVTPETFEAYVQEANSYAVDALKDARREARTYRWGFLGCAIATAAMGFAVATLVTRHSEHWGILISDATSGTTRVLKDVGDASLNLPASIDSWFMERYVQMREGWNEANADAAFQAVACMSDPDEAKAFAAWYNDAKTAPQQIFTKAHRGWRDVTTAEPAIDGRTVGGAMHIGIPFKYQDRGLSETPKEIGGTARFTVRKDRKAIQPCNPAGLVISDYTHPLDREVLP